MRKNNHYKMDTENHKLKIYHIYNQKKKIRTNQLKNVFRLPNVL